MFLTDSKNYLFSLTAQKMKFSIKYFFSKFDLDLVTFTKKSSMENFIFCAVADYKWSL